ncbi:MAG: hypothetical protein A3D34_01695 [Candidatus Staskawiczbacteria bacterium RIFCSPHIGHO2_02_FULL_33_16]|uniref:Uncharacterized protein n=1 Tax=Candidatus Staskawiczbacteria bacterium RIFCSPHIGHO2_02_FULL_33_16 TaxID=1802204 RepID=A0A1G2HU22_9BACT|nr:MAG: hypothetical protein A3D34_01695 [Candidatus Staskawiczbacteria bacterium RIFCSPHIGHO2_02_FULL_33_16]OGZ70540.1 MAG: hypothetical protein A2980_01155 [Candidatus Staskawiczbacteria bacterium RIFCSPLOWO2_01_FULL_33_13]
MAETSLTEQNPEENSPEEISPEELERRDREQQWLDPENTSENMLRLVRRMGLSRRKYRLFINACCRSVWSSMIDERCRETVEVADRYIEGISTDKEAYGALHGVNNANQEALSATEDNIMNSSLQISLTYLAARSILWINNGDYEDDLSWAGAMATVGDLTSVKQYLAKRFRGSHRSEADTLEMRSQGNLLRDIFGDTSKYNPFSKEKIVIDPTWLTANGGAVPRLAETIYNERSFKDMVVLWDALEEAGCTNEEIRKHCQGDGQHVRGCWVIDLILQKGEARQNEK